MAPGLPLSIRSLPASRMQSNHPRQRSLPALPINLRKGRPAGNANSAHYGSVLQTKHEPGDRAGARLHPC
jgi:hypothetical protein